MLLAPSRAGLQPLINELSNLLCGISLKINVAKSWNIEFNKKGKGDAEACVNLQGFSLQRMSEMIYSGVVITDAFNIAKDMDRATNSFLKQFNSLHYKLNNAN